MTAPGSPPPNWYPDPSGRAGFRWWDGRGWTDFTGPAGPGGPTGTQLRTARIVGATAVVLAILGLILSRHRVTVRSGPSVVWLGVALIGAALLMSLLVPKVRAAIRIVVLLALVAGLVSGFFANRWVDRHRHPGVKPVGISRPEPASQARAAADPAPGRARCASADAR